MFAFELLKAAAEYTSDCSKIIKFNAVFAHRVLVMATETLQSIRNENNNTGIPCYLTNYEYNIL